MAYNFPRREVLLSNQPASSSGSIAFTSVINSNFGTYLVKIRNMLPQTNATSLLLTFSTDNGSTYLNSNYRYGTAFSTTVHGDASQSSSASSITVVTLVSSTTSRGFNGDYYFFGINQSVEPCMYGSSVHEGSDNICALIFNVGSNTTTTAVTAIKFAMSSGNINSGNFYLYGISE